MCIDALFLFLRQIHCNSAHKYHASGQKQNGGDASRPANEAGDASALIFMRSAAVKGEKEK